MNSHAARIGKTLVRVFVAFSFVDGFSHHSAPAASPGFRGHLRCAQSGQPLYFHQMADFVKTFDLFI
jgi:hypothetical protein